MNWTATRKCALCSSPRRARLSVSAQTFSSGAICRLWKWAGAGSATGTASSTATRGCPNQSSQFSNGYTFGGGLELALAADLRLAAEGAQLSFPEVKLGIIPGWGGTQRLAQLVGPSRAKQMIFSGEGVAAEQAETWGLVNEVVPPEQLAERALELAKTIAANGPVAVQLTKQLIDAAMPANGDSGVVLETLAGSLASYTADAQEGVSAFRQRRQPQFSGR